MSTVEGSKNSYDMQEEIEHYLYDFPKATPETLTKEYLEKLIAELTVYGSSDPEVAHRLEKAAMECFIFNVVQKKYTAEEAAVIGQLILNIGVIPFSRWFA